MVSVGTPSTDSLLAFSFLSTWWWQSLYKHSLVLSTTLTNPQKLGKKQCISWYHLSHSNRSLITCWRETRKRSRWILSVLVDTNKFTLDSLTLSGPILVFLFLMSKDQEPFRCGWAVRGALLQSIWDLLFRNWSQISRGRSPTQKDSKKPA